MIDSNTMKTTYEEYYFAMYKYAYKLCRDKQTAEDITADAFLKFVEQLNKGVAIENIRSYLYQSVYHGMVDRYRRDKQTAPLEVAENITNRGLTVHGQVENEMMVTWFMSKLSRKQYRVIFLRFFDGLSHERIGQIIGMKEKNVRNNTTNAMNKLRKLQDRMEASMNAKAPRGGAMQYQKGGEEGVVISSHFTRYG